MQLALLEKLRKAREKFNKGKTRFVKCENRQWFIIDNSES